MKDYTCLMPFLDESHSFTHGWECGSIWEKMTAGESFDNQPVHRANQEQITMMAEHFGYEYSFTDMGEDWMGFKAQPVDISGIKEEPKP